MTFLVFSTERFHDKANRHNIPKERIKKISEQLKQNPYVGKPLSYPFLREKRVDDKRIYYLVYEDLGAVLLVSVSDKKMQQQTIDEIKMSFNILRGELERKLHGFRD